MSSVTPDEVQAMIALGALSGFAADTATPTTPPPPPTPQLASAAAAAAADTTTATPPPPADAPSHPSFGGVPLPVAMHWMAMQQSNQPIDTNVLRMIQHHEQQLQQRQQQQQQEQQDQEQQPEPEPAPKLAVDGANKRLASGPAVVLDDDDDDNGASGGPALNPSLLGLSVHHVHRLAELVALHVINDPKHERIQIDWDLVSKCYDMHPKLSPEHCRAVWRYVSYFTSADGKSDADVNGISDPRLYEDDSDIEAEYDTARKKRKMAATISNRLSPFHANAGYKRKKAATKGATAAASAAAGASSSAASASAAASSSAAPAAKKRVGTTRKVGHWSLKEELELLNMMVSLPVLTWKNIVDSKPAPKRSAAAIRRHFKSWCEDFEQGTIAHQPTRDLLTTIFDRIPTHDVRGIPNK